MACGVEGVMVKTIGEELMKRSGNGELCVRIASIFPKAKTLVALPEMPLHAYQRASFADSVNQARLERGEPPLSAEQYQAEMDQAVDLLVNDQGVLIRPDPSRMDLALAADELLQELVPKRLIQYLLLSDSRVRDALKQRGECWRMFLPPTAPKQIRRMIAEAKSGIGGKPIYYYSPISGTRFLTYESFRKLAEFDDADLRAHLIEIATYCKQHNSRAPCRLNINAMTWMIRPGASACLSAWSRAGRTRGPRTSRWASTWTFPCASSGCRARASRTANSSSTRPLKNHPAASRTSTFPPSSTA
jgi:hypothetical protein